ncbi:MAG: hypothetical protein AB8I08_19845 [Sandaracinaceae bacterium]
MNRRTETLLFALLGWLVVMVGPGCVATPLPTPPTATASQMMLLDGQPGEVDLIGGPAALTGDGLLSLRVTGASGSVSTRVEADGSFMATGIPSTSRADTFYLEAITLDADVFVLALTGGPGTSAVDAPPGPDRDGDLSPDAIDCAPDDGMLAGQRCTCGPIEFCGNGLDDNCDGFVDEALCSPVCSADDECAAGERCVDAVCVPM